MRYSDLKPDKKGFRITRKRVLRKKPRSSSVIRVHTKYISPVSESQKLTVRVCLSSSNETTLKKQARCKQWLITTPPYYILDPQETMPTI